jgi:probable phosphoglycerate mutase
MPSELVLVRHGLGLCNEAGVIGGTVGCRGLSPRGVAESRRLAGLLAAGPPVEVLLSSPRPRVRECAGIIGSRLRLPVVEVAGLRGQDFGHADGASWQAVTASFGGEPSSRPDVPIAEGAESWNTYADRVLSTLRSVLAEHAGRRICLVGHGRTTALAAALLSGAPDPWDIDPESVLEHGSLARWRLDRAGWRQVHGAPA